MKKYFIAYYTRSGYDSAMFFSNEIIDVHPLEWLNERRQEFRKNHDWTTLIYWREIEPDENKYLELKFIKQLKSETEKYENE